MSETKRIFQASSYYGTEEETDQFCKWCGLPLVEVIGETTYNQKTGAIERQYYYKCCSNKFLWFMWPCHREDTLINCD